MKFLFTSDLHGNIEAVSCFASLLPKYDAGIISGDLLCLRTNEAEENKMKHLLKAAGVPVYFLMGNMDSHYWQSEDNLVNINQKIVELDDYCLVGYQYTDPFAGGIFEKTAREQEKDLAKMEQDLAGYKNKKIILASHGPAYAVLDKIKNDFSVGSKSLAAFVKAVQPYLHLFGHIHESAGIEGNSVNGAWPELKKFVEIDTAAPHIKLIDS